MTAAEEPPRCGARLRGGERRCDRPPEPGRRRCRRHGGAPGIGAPAGNRNALKHGCFTREALDERRFLAELIRESWKTLHEVEAEMKE